MADALKEILKFLQLGARLDLKAVALTHVLGKNIEFMVYVSVNTCF